MQQCLARLCFNAMQAAGTTWRGEVESVNRGGVVVDVHGLRGFIPLSRLAPDRLQALDRQEDQKGQPIAAKIIKVGKGLALIASYRRSPQSCKAQRGPADAVSGSRVVFSGKGCCAHSRQIIARAYSTGVGISLTLHFGASCHSLQPYFNRQIVLPIPSALHASPSSQEVPTARVHLDWCQMQYQCRI